MELHTGTANTPRIANTAASSSASTTVIADEKTMAQYNDDARLLADFEESGQLGKFFDYTKSVSSAPKPLSSQAQMKAYLTKIQRGGLVQSFGCMLVIQEPSFKILGFSENCSEMLGLGDLIGIDATTLFSPSSRAPLAKALGSREVSFMNPILVNSRVNDKAFYAILHRIDVGIVIDLEPLDSSDPDKIHASTFFSQKLAVRAINKLQCLPEGNIGTLFDTLVEDVRNLTGYDRVMVYKFHDDNHGEIISEIRRSELEAYQGIHYPATDIPQAARFLFKQNRVRMIHDCNSEPVKVIQSKELKQPICLVNSTLRAPHGCHSQYMTNMGSIASLVMSLIVNNGEEMKLWGLVVCHHTTPRYVQFPLRYALEFLMQAFSLQLQMELQMVSQLKEKKILRVQALLSEMLLRDVPLGIVTKSPNIMDLVQCEGAALYYGGRAWLLGVTPTGNQLQTIVEWLLKTLGDSMGLSTDSLAEAGYPGAALLGDAVCGMAAARISSSNFLFWFRSHTANEFKWGGGKPQPEEKDNGKMHPRSSFNAFLETVRSRSMQWEATEINAIHSLQLIMRDSLQKIEEGGSKYGAYFQPSECNDSELDELTSMTVEMVRLIETATAPIFGVDSAGLINGWNTKMCELTGLDVSEALGKSLISDVVHEDSREAVELLLARALQGKEDKDVEVKLVKFGVNAPNSFVYILVNSCTSRDYKNDIVGVCFVGQDITVEKTAMDRFIRLQGDYKAIIQSANPLIPPIFASDENACCSEWNAVMENLTGWMRHEVVGKLLPGEIFGSICQLKGSDILTKFMILLYRAISGHDTEKLAFGFFNRKGEFVEVNLTASKRVNESGDVIGCLCFLQTVMIIEKESVVDNKEEKERLSKEMAYIMQEMKNPMSGIRFTHQFLQGSVISEDQKRFLDTSDACERQILSIIDNGHLRSLEEGTTELKVEEFVLGNVVNAVVSQAMILLRRKSLHFIRDIPEQIKTLCLYGDQMKLQLALSDFLVSIVDYAPSPDGWVEIKVSPGFKLIHDGNEYVHLEFRMAHPGKGLPGPLIEDMFGIKNTLTTHEGIALNISQKLISMMNGNVRYIREQSRCYFQIELELRSTRSG